MTSRVTKRVRYFVGKFLKKKDFEEEQDYHLSKHGTVKKPGVAKANIKKSSAKKANTKSTSVKKNTDD